MTIASPAELEKAAAYLSDVDETLAEIIARAGPCTITPNKDYYWSLIDAIISQQLSVKAAATIEKRFQDLFASDHPQPHEILEKSVEDLRAVGLSNAKAAYVRDLAQHSIDGKLDFTKFDGLSNDEIIAELTAVKGIGEWTAHMFLMFCMGRLDVLPTGDLGIRNGIRALYGFSDTPTPEQIREMSVKCSWHPYESVASWYIWHSLDNKPAI